MHLQEPDPFVGMVVGERYRILELLGRGGMGVVYRAEHIMMKKELALKLLHPELSRLDEVARRFEREAEAAARLSHPNIIAVTDFGRTRDGQLYLAMELLAGRTLSDLIRAERQRGRGLEPARAVRILEQILRALDHAHAGGVIHRDLKPDNIMVLDRAGAETLKLLDFGIAKISAGEGQPGEALTQAGVVFGTPEYLSPEQALGEVADGRADLYAAGVILYELLSGRRPFESDSKVEVVAMHLTRRAPPLRLVDSLVSRPLEQVVERAMAKKRQDRFATAAEFLRALAQSLAPLPRRRLRRLLLPAGIPALIGITLVATALLGIKHRSRPDRPAAVRQERPRQREEPARPTPDSRNPAAEALRKGRTCRERRAAAFKLIAAEDEHFLPDLLAARDRRGGFLGLQNANRCMIRELEAAIRRLEAKDR